MVNAQYNRVINVLVVHQLAKRETKLVDTMYVAKKVKGGLLEPLSDVGT